ncbi:MAG TPA: HDOD domain-containing protein [Terriglobales bacterium]|nr:HDOD domain-containing protein [Terriglobales bacterium]
MNADRLQQLKAQVGKLNSISTAPAILQPLLEILRQPAEEVPYEKVVELASYDGAIAAQCLRLANSPLFGCRQIETVRAAIAALGIERMRTMLLGVCVNQVIPKNKWVLDPVAFWRHSLGCALVTQRMAKGIGYPEPDKAYLAGLLHDLGFLVNSILYTENFRKSLQLASARHTALHVCEQEILGFTHCESGQLLCEHWRLSQDLSDAARWHHDVPAFESPRPLASLVHLSDLLCRVCNLGYGYDEIMSVELARDSAWQTLVTSYPSLADVDLVRFTVDIESAMSQIVATVDSVFGVSSAAVRG